MTCNYSSYGFKYNNKENSPALMISLKCIRSHINRSTATNKEYVLPIAEDKAGAYTCKVTVGTAVSAESASSAITATGFSLGTLHFHRYILNMIYNYKHDCLWLCEENPAR